MLKDSDSEAIRQAIEELDPKYRQTILMRYYDDFSFKEIAHILKLPMGTVSRRIQIAHHLLAAKLGSKLGRKPVAVLLAVLLGIGTLFGAYQAAEAIFTPSTPTSTPTPTPSTSTSSSTLITTKEKPPMNTIKGTLLAAATAVSLMSTAQADEPTPVTPDTVESSGAGTVKKVGDDYVLSFMDTTKTYALTLPDGVKSIRYLVVAGGGAGGGSYTKWVSGGGGGAGGMLTGEGITVETGNALTIKVGKGGAGSNAGLGDDGEDSVLQISGNEVRAWGGGGGGGGMSGSDTVKSPNAGGSGGGGNGSGSKADRPVKICAGAAAKEEDGSTQGCAGGGVANDGGEAARCAGGGGGAGGKGEAGTSGGSAKGGNGGLGKTCDITGEDNVYYAGGGGGGAWDGGRTPGEGGSYIGGTGGKGPAGGPGKDGTGSGGGGGSVSGGGGKGGDGIVIIRYTSSATAKAKVHFSYDPNTVTWVATDIGGEVIKEDGEVDDDATIEVVATPKDDYEYASAPEGWAKNEDDTITADFKAKAPECTIQIPAATAIPFTMNFTPGANASYTATVEGQSVQNGAKIRTGKQIVVVATPNTDCEYTAIPDGWKTGEVEGTLTRTITAGEGMPQLTIPDAAAIDYVQVQFTSNGSAFFEATNAVGEKVEGRVRAGTEVFVKIWAGVGFVYNETPTGWTWEAEGDAYTKAFTAVSGSTLTIQIPNAKEIGGRWTKEIPANVGYKLEVGKDLVYVFTNTAEDGCEMILPGGVTSLRYLVVGGGGAGGGQHGGGGGAGGMLTDDDFKVVGRTLKINVGQGGAGVNDAVAGTSGGDSTLKNGVASIIAYGGGGGGAGRTSSAVEGGSGGGGGGTTGDAKTPLPGASAKDPLQGNAGGTGAAYCNACGGGGAGEPGKAGSSTVSGAGGAGRTCDITGEDNKYYAAGGGGASRNSSSSGGVGGSGIGGNGGKNADGLRAGLPGKDGTGSGGGGAAGDTDDYSGKGGDGVVILRFAKPKSGIVIFIM